MKIIHFSSSDEAGQYLVNSDAPKSHIRPTEDGKVERLITYADGSQEMLVSPPTTRTFDEAIERLKKIAEEQETQFTFKNVPPLD